MQDYYIKMVDESVGTSIAYVRTFVRTYVSQRIQDARDNIAEYGEKYQAAMLAALETSRQGAAPDFPSCSRTSFAFQQPS